jgi:hypothetical protein
MHNVLITYLSIAWTVLAVGLVLGMIASIWRIIPRREE